jgi:hypothetical protein
LVLVASSCLSETVISMSGQKQESADGGDLVENKSYSPETSDSELNSPEDSSDDDDAEEDSGSSSSSSSASNYKQCKNCGRHHLPIPKKKCQYCGREDMTKHYTFVPIRFEKFDFCKEGKCYNAYWSYTYEPQPPTDLTNGLPFYLTKKNPFELDNIERKCSYCGKFGADVMENVLMDPAKYSHRTFCRNEKCCAAYIKTLEQLPAKPVCLE